MTSFEVCKLLRDRMIKEGYIPEVADAVTDIMYYRNTVDERILEVGARVNTEGEIEVYNLSTNEVVSTIVYYFGEYHHSTSPTWILVGLFVNEGYKYNAILGIE